MMNFNAFGSDSLVIDSSHKYHAVSILSGE